MKVRKLTICLLADPWGNHQKKGDHSKGFSDGKQGSFHDFPLPLLRRVVAKIPWNGSVVLLQMSSMLLSSMTRAGRACEQLVVLVLPL